MKKFFVLMFVFMFCISFTSALDWDNVKYISEELDKYGYPEITIKDSILRLIPLGDLSNIKLEYHQPQCLIDCNSKPKITIYEPTAIIEDIRFLDKKGNELNLPYSITLNELETYEVEVNDYKEVCEISLNETKICNQELIGSHKEIKIRTIVNEYLLGTIKEEGIYIPNINVQKPKDKSIDYQLKINGKWIEELAWWDSNWKTRKQVNITGSTNDIINFTIFLNVTFDSDMQSDFDDIRFIDGNCSGVQDTELSLDKINYTESNSALIYARLPTMTNTLDQICMYYNNPIATDSSSPDAYDFDNVWHFQDDFIDSKGLNNCSIASGAVPFINSQTGKGADFENDRVICGDTSVSGDELSFLIISETDSFAGGGDNKRLYTKGANGAEFGSLLTDVGSKWLWFLLDGTQAQSNRVIVIGDNNTIGQVYNGSNMREWIDGDLTITTAKTGNVPDAGTEFTMGTNEDGSNPWDGMIDEIWRVNRALSDDYVVRWANITNFDLITFGDEEEINEITAILNSPIDGFNTSSLNILFNVSGTSPTGVLNLTLIIDDIFNETIFNTTSFQNLTLIINLTLTDENHNYTAQACDSAGCDTAIARNFEIDTIVPQINLDEPSGQISSFIFGNNLTINWSVSDTNLESCWFEYNNINTSVICIANNFSFIPVVDVQNLTFYANDSFNNLGSNFTSWTYAFVENNATFNATSQETSRESFILNMSTDLNVLSISAILDYNGTEHISIASCEGSNCLISNTIDINLVETGESELHNFFWNFTIFNGTGSNNIITSTRTQNVSRIHLEQCNATFTTKTINFTTFDEQNLSRVSPFSFDGFFEFWVGSGTTKRNNSLSKNITEMNLCLEPSITMKIDATIDYDETQNTSLYTSRFYYFDEFSISNTLQQIKMYLLKSTESTSFILKVQDENLLPVADALIEIHRFYPGEGDFRIVQIAKTDDNGKSIGFFQTETVDYKFIIKKDGETLLETGQQKVIPETSPFTLTFNTGEDLGEPWSSQNDIVLLNSTLIPSEDNSIVTYTYVDSSGNFTLARLLVQRQSLTNSSAYTTICNDTSALSSSLITCSVGNTTGFYIASSFITRTGEGLDLQINFQIENFSSASGLLGLFYGFFLIVIASFMFKFNEVAGIWAVTMTVFLINIMGLIKFGSVFVSGIIAIALILTWAMEK